MLKTNFSFQIGERQLSITWAIIYLFLFYFIFFICYLFYLFILFIFNLFNF